MKLCCIRSLPLLWVLHLTELNNKVVAVADSKNRDMFSDLTSPIFQKIDILKSKNQNLRQTRDLLLPKLISGEIDVSELDINKDSTI